MTRIRKLHQVWLKDPEYRAAYDALAYEFAVAEASIDAKARSSASENKYGWKLAQDYVND